MRLRLHAGTSALAALSVLMLVWTGIGNRLHEREQHVRCPEHGELMHVADDGERAPDASVRASDQDHGHDHCDLLAIGRTRAALGSTAPIDVPGFGQPVLALAAPPAVADAQEVLLLAPKTSPPV